MTSRDWDLLTKIPPEWDMLNDIHEYMTGPAPRRPQMPRKPSDISRCAECALNDECDRIIIDCRHFVHPSSPPDRKEFQRRRMKSEKQHEKA
jgi:hypothetical protein